MKFEHGLAIEAQELKNLREQGLKIPAWEQYREYNRQELPQLLQKRMEENKAFAERSKKRLVFLTQSEQEGVLAVKL